MTAQNDNKTNFIADMLGIQRERERDVENEREIQEARIMNEKERKRESERD